MGRTFVCITLVLSLAAVAHADARSVRKQQVGQAARSARHALASGRPSQARQQLRASVRRYPGEAQLLALYASLLLPLDSSEPWPKDAAAASRELLELAQRAARVPGDKLSDQDPEQERQLALHLAVAEATLGRFEDGLARAVEAGRLQDAASVACLRRIAALAVRADALVIAEQALALARQYVPQDRALAPELARVLLARGKVDPALELLASEFAADPGSLAARADLAYATAGQGRAADALALLDQAQQACAQDRGCALLAARAAVEAERLSEASAYARPHASRGDLDALYVLADAEQRAGHLDEARTAYQQILKLRPESVRARQALEQLAGR